MLLNPLPCHKLSHILDPLLPPRARVLYGRPLWRTWPGSVITALSRRASASQARSRAAWTDCGRKPLRFSLFINCSMRARSGAEEKPHQAGDAYISEATVVDFATRFSN